MTADVKCRPLKPPLPDAVLENSSDPFSDLLSSLADLRVDIARKREQLQTLDPGDERVASATAELAELDELTGELAARGSAIHHRLQHDHLI
jgi:hypothetical protein